MSGPGLACGSSPPGPRALAEGRSVAEVASEVGYESVSAFGAMFHRKLGVTPGSL